MALEKTKGIRLDMLLIISLIAGIGIGAAVGANMTPQGLMTIYSDGVYAAGDDWVSAFFSYFIGSAAFVTAAFLMGFCAVSQPFELALVAFKGMGLGVRVRSIYSCDNILIRIALFIPFAVLSSGILIMQSCDSVAMSTRYLMLSVTAENRLGIAHEFRNYIFRFLIYLTACAAVSALNCLILRLFDYFGMI